MSGLVYLRAVCAIGLLLVSLGCEAKKEVATVNLSLVSFLADLTNVARLADSPAGPIRMETSYDRSGGNNDGSCDLGKDKDGKIILADLRGPGCVRRLWMTGMPITQKFYFFFDDEPRPRFTRTMAELAGEGGYPFTPPLCDDPSGAGICYLPMPYLHRLLIKSDPVPPPFFYHVNYESLGTNVPVQSFRLEDWNGCREQLESVRNQWLSLQSEDQTPAVPPDSAPPLAEGSNGLVFRTNGPALCEELRIRPEFPGGITILEKNRWLRDVVLRIYWDDLVQPSVETPLGDFFCNGVRPRAFRSMVMSYSGGEYVCRWPMPFRQSMRLELENQGTIPVPLTLRGRLRPLPEETAPASYFQACWNQTSNPGRPHEILQFAGSGYYVGCYLVAIGMDGSWNMLESDEVITLDGEPSPSLHGTGMEDYFNGGWYYNHGTFVRPLSGALEKSPVRTSQYRWHVPDPIRFSQSIRMNIEFGHGNATRGYMSSVAYWYSRKPTPVPVRIAPVQARAIPRDPLEPTCMMGELFERERVGHLAEALDLALEYQQKYSDSPEAELMGLRALAYQESLSGYPSVSNAYAQSIASALSPETRRQAQLLQWVHAAPTNALLLAHVNGDYRMYLDGNLVVDGNDFRNVGIAPVTLSPGKHVLAARATAVRPMPWFSAYLRSATTSLWTDASWKVATREYPDWKSLAYDDRGWQAAKAYGPLPYMSFFQFRPNAIIGSQCRQQLLCPTNGWRENETVYYRKVFSVP